MLTADAGTGRAGCRVVRFRVASLLHSYTGGLDTIAIGVPLEGDRAPSLREALAALDARCPGIGFRIVDEQGALRAHVRAFVGSESCRDLDQPLREEAEVMIVGALSGG